MKKVYITALRRGITAMLLWGLWAGAHAIEITSTKSEYVPGGVRYYFEVTSWGYGLISSPCSTNESIYTTCYITLAARIIPSVNLTAAVYAEWEVPVRRDSYMKDLLKDLENKGFRIPLTGSVVVDTKHKPSNLCIGFLYVKIGPTIGGGPSSMGTCARVVPPPLQCKISGDATIDHKSVMDNAVDGATASTKLYVQCQGPASLTVSTTRTDAYGVRLKSDGSLYSNVTVNGKDATAGIEVPITQGQNTPLTVTSTLVKRGDVMPGEFIGFTVLTISPP